MTTPKSCKGGALREIPLTKISPLSVVPDRNIERIEDPVVVEGMALAARGIEPVEDLHAPRYQTAVIEVQTAA